MCFCSVPKKLKINFKKNQIKKAKVYFKKIKTKIFFLSYCGLTRNKSRKYHIKMAEKSTVQVLIEKEEKPPVGVLPTGHLANCSRKLPKCNHRKFFKFII